MVQYNQVKMCKDNNEKRQAGNRKKVRSPKNNGKTSPGVSASRSAIREPIFEHSKGQTSSTGRLAKAKEAIPQEGQDIKEQPNQATLRRQEIPSTTVEILMFLNSMETYNKIYGHLVVDEKHRIMFADGQAKELLEATHSNLENKTMADFIIEAEKQNFKVNCFKDLKNLSDSKWMDMLVYSRSTIRKYGAYPELGKPTGLDYFFRYLRSLRVEVSPIVMDFKGYESYKEEFWNEKLIQASPQLPCYLFRVCCSKRIPDLSKVDFGKDSHIAKLKALALEKNERKNGKVNKIEKAIEWQMEEASSMDSEQEIEDGKGELLESKLPRKMNIKIRKTRVQRRPKPVHVRRVRKSPRPLALSARNKKLLADYNVQVDQQRKQWYEMEIEPQCQISPYAQVHELQISDLNPEDLLFPSLEPEMLEEGLPCQWQEIRTDDSYLSQFLNF